MAVRAPRTPNQRTRPAPGPADSATSTRGGLALTPQAPIARFQGLAGNRVVTSMIARSTGSGRRPRQIQRKMSKGEGWTASTGASFFSSVTLGSVAWTQPQIDQEWIKISGPHATLKSSIDSSESASGNVTDKTTSSGGIATAKEMHQKWDKQVNWADREAANTDIQKGITAIGGASDAIKLAHKGEVAELEKQLGKPISDKLLGDRGYTPAELSETLGSLSARAIKKIADPLTVGEFKRIMESDNIGWANLKKLAELGGDDVYAFVRTGLDFEALFGDGSNAQQVSTVVKGLEKASVAVVEGLGAKYISTKLLTPLTKDTLETLTTKLTGEQIKELADALPPEVIKPIAAANAQWPVNLHDQRDYVAKLLKKMTNVLFVECYTHISPNLMKKLWEGKPEKDVADALRVIGKDAVKDLIKDVSQAEFWHASARLSNTGLKGLGGAMTGKQLKSLTGGLEKDPAAAPAVGPAAPTDEMLKTLGKDHADALKAGKAWLTFETFDMVLRRLQQATVDAPKSAEFLEKAVAYRWKTKAKLEAFFDKAGVNVMACVAIADDFETAGNPGTRGEKAGGGGSGVKVHTRNFGGKDYAVCEGDVDHYMAGHSYSHYAMTDDNAKRGTSTMWPVAATRDTIKADAGTALASGLFGTRLVPAAGAGFAVRNVGAFEAGLDASNNRLTQLYPDPGIPLAQARMEAVVKLFQAKE